MRSKEEDMLEIFFNNPTKELHFEEILKDANIARSKCDRWLKEFIKKGLIRRIKKKGEMPYYISSYDSPAYKNKKKIFALNKFYEHGLLDHLSSIKKAKAVILFGSFSRSDWYKGSDIDIFIYGDVKGLRLAQYETKLKRNIELFHCKDKIELKRYGQGLIKNIIKGTIIKGDIDFIKVGIDA